MRLEDDQDQNKGEMASSTILKGAKKELRSLMKKRLSGISNDSIQAQSTALYERLITFKPYQEAKRIGVYLSMPSGEIQTEAIVRHALGHGKQVFVPHIQKPRDQTLNTPRPVMDMVDLRDLKDFKELRRDSWGIPTIGTNTVGEREHILKSISTKSEVLDLILMPGVAFDIDPESGFIRRLGHGKGFYDNFLHQYSHSRGSQTELSIDPGTDILLYGLALEEQFLPSGADFSVPVGEHDSLLHGLLLGNGQIREGPNRTPCRLDQLLEIELPIS
ncbi:5-formyltetrahydrofolate cyclo-ligase [Chlorociboria aeruginascens]|nr:5-formyltetrahydrofolate cyclo-ligase [Chlorociboria aeruginascens]